MKKDMIKASSAFERVVHWSMALFCLLLCITGMGMMYHSLNFIGELMGGMIVLKYVHNFSGLFFGVSLLFAFGMWWKEAGLFSFPEDLQWLKAFGGYLWRVDKMPEVGKYNFGQKIFFLVVAGYGMIMVVSGLIMWFPLSFSTGLVRIMFVLHALGFVLILPFFFIHLYMATIGVPGSAPAMLTGWVTRAWLKNQHPKWLKEMEKDGTLVVYDEEKQRGHH
ncbi:MAG: formate dehydrogenase subunit gamma [Desulfobulbaceae bacterium]|nr:formate dehydrogenase subunit gamma [Desulfobulbaceae bacterium]